MITLKIGIDPGVNTGFAVIQNGKIIDLQTLKIHKALALLYQYALSNKLKVVVEDAWRRGGSVVRAQGAGSVKRDTTIWRDFLADLQRSSGPIGLEYLFVRPTNDRIRMKCKKDETYFKQLTGWQNRCSEHARDAAMLVWGL